MLKSLLLLIAGGYIIVAISMYFAQRQLVYQPAREARADPASLGLSGVTEIEIAAPDGGSALAWYGRARPGQPTLLYFHGNAGSLASRSERTAAYLARGRGVMMMTYRGYSGTPGTPSEDVNVADAMRAFDWLAAHGVPRADIIVYGESLGSGVAVKVAAEKKPASLVLDAPYTSLVDVAAYHYPWLPVRPMLRERYDSAAKIADVQCPLLIVHGARDATIPVAMGRELFAKANEPKTFVEFPAAGHADHYMFGSFNAVNRWIDALRSAEQHQR